VETLGELAALQLARHIVTDVEPERRQLLLPVELIVRGSTAPLR
jgi:DNA-binding LacI/PurR family transcriptional regulator